MRFMKLCTNAVADWSYPTLGRGCADVAPIRHQGPRVGDVQRDGVAVVLELTSS